MSYSLQPHGLQTPAHQTPLFMGIFQARILEGGAIPCPGDHPHSGMEPGSPAWQADSLPFEPSGKPKGKKDI